MADTVNTPYIGLARRYRPQTFSDLVGQDQIARALEQQVGQEKVSQAYIFSGPRGIGKTSTARILAKCLNCAEGPTATPCGKCEQCRSIVSGSGMDVIEIDGASNNSVDDIRHLQETISQNPFSARKKIYIIDEVHMLSKGAFNALLKTLEEPPSFVIFIFATTEYERIPETIQSRCQTLHFRRISVEDLVRRLDHVAEQEKIEMDPDERRAILESIAFAVDGGARDAMMALDQIAALSDGQVSLDETVRFLGVVEHDLLIQTVEWLTEGDTRALLTMVNDLVERGRDLERFVKNLLGFLRDLMVLKAGGSEDLVHFTSNKLERARALLWQEDERGRQAERLTYPALLNYIQVFMDLEARMKEAVQVRVHLEFAFVKLAAIEPVVDIAHLIQNFDRLSAGKAPAAPPKANPSPASEASPAPAPAKPKSAPQPDTPALFQKSAPGPSKPATPADLPSPDELWQSLLAGKQQLGMALSLALAECRCVGVDEKEVRIQAPGGSLSLGTLRKQVHAGRLEEALRRLLGRQVALKISAGPRDPAPGNDGPDHGAPSFQHEPVLREEDPLPPEPEDDSYYESSKSTYDLFLAQNPTARTAESLRNNPAVRDKVEMVRKFFDGKLFDFKGREIVI